MALYGNSGESEGISEDVCIKKANKMKDIMVLT